MYNKKLLFILFILAVLVGGTSPFLIQAYTKSPMVESNTVRVSLANNKAIPDVVTVMVGDYVQFNTEDNKSHNIGQGRGDELEELSSHDHEENSIESGIFSKDEGYKIQFKKTGVYHFHDHLNPHIFVTVIVT